MKRIAHSILYSLICCMALTVPSLSVASNVKNVQTSMREAVGIAKTLQPAGDLRLPLTAVFDAEGLLVGTLGEWSTEQSAEDLEALLKSRATSGSVSFSDIAAKLAALEGQAQGSGSVVVVSFGAACPPCEQLAGDLVGIAEKFPDTQFYVLTASAPGAARR